MRIHQRALVLLLGWSLFSQAAVAQLPQGPGYVRLWARTYGGGLPWEGLFDLRQSSDGELRAAGFTTAFGGTSAAGWLLHLNPRNGDVELERSVSHLLASAVDGAGIADDGGALFTGRDVLDLFTKHDAWAVRVDADGGVLWSRGFTRPGFGRHFLFDAAELADGSWIAAGAASLIDQPPQAAWLVRLSAQGVPLWQFEYGGGVSESVESVLPTSDGGFVTAGWTNSSGAGSTDAWVMKVESAGAIEWQQTYGGSDSDQATDIVELTGGGFVVSAYTNSLTSSGHAPWILRLDGNGGLLWHAVVGDQVWGDLYAVAETPAGQVIALGRVGQPGFPTNDLWAVEMSATDGTVLWQRAYEGDSGDWGSAVLPLAGGGLLLGGVWGWGFPVEDAWLLRTDSAGRLPGCGIVRTTKFSLGSPVVDVQAGVAVEQVAGAMLQPTSFGSSPTSATVVNRCP